MVLNCSYKNSKEKCAQCIKILLVTHRKYAIKQTRTPADYNKLYFNTRALFEFGHKNTIN